MGAQSPEGRMSLVALLIIGAAAGFLATRLMKIEADIPTTVAVGVIGALVGGLVLRFLTMVGGWMAGFVGAVAGAALILALWRRYGRK